MSLLNKHSIDYGIKPVVPAVMVSMIQCRHVFFSLFQGAPDIRGSTVLDDISPGLSAAGS